MTRWKHVRVESLPAPPPHEARWAKQSALGPAYDADAVLEPRLARRHAVQHSFELALNHPGNSGTAEQVLALNSDRAPVRLDDSDSTPASATARRRRRHRHPKSCRRQCSTTCGHCVEEGPAVHRCGHRIAGTPSLSQCFVEQGPDRARLMQVQERAPGHADRPGVREVPARDKSAGALFEGDPQTPPRLEAADDKTFAAALIPAVAQRVVVMPQRPQEDLPVDHEAPCRLLPASHPQRVSAPAYPPCSCALSNNCRNIAGSRDQCPCTGPQDRRSAAARNATVSLAASQGQRRCRPPRRAKSSGLAAKINIVSLRSASAGQPVSTHIRQPRSKSREPTAG